MRHLEKLGFAAAVCVIGFWPCAAEEPPREWIEPATGHRVIRLSREPGTSSLYFHQNAVDLTKHNYELEPNVTFTPDGKWVVFRSNMHGATQVYAVAVNKAG